MWLRAAMVSHILVATVLCALAATVPANEPSARTAHTIIARHMAAAAAGEALEIGGEPLTAAAAMVAFYAGRQIAPAWTDPARARELLALASAADRHGLNPEDYLVAELRTRLGQAARTPTATAELDLLLSEALLRYFAHRSQGKVEARRLDPKDNSTQAPPGPEALAAMLAESLAAASLQQHLEDSVPGSPLYDALVAVLADYKALAAAGGWPMVPPGRTLHPGDNDARVEALRDRLAFTADAAAAQPPDPHAFDEPLVAAVKRFQLRHQIDVDGIVGPDTLAALNVPVTSRIDQLRLSLERLRWVQREPSPVFVAVNIAGFRVFVIRNRQVSWSARAMVGRHYRQTPLFRGEITYLEFNPAWTVPPTILIEDLLPKLKTNPAYLADEHMRVLDLEGREVDATTIDWSVYEQHVPYLFRQDAGPWNALGAVKFVFPNPYLVFMHDTPHRSLFENPKRSFSSGCIRVEDPVGLAVELFGDPQRYGPDHLQAVIDSGKTRRIALDQPVPILVLYLTATVRDDGLVYFFPDIYGRDPRVLAALDAPITAAGPLPAGH